MLQHGELFHCSGSLKGENCCFFVYQRAGWMQGEREELGVEKYRKQKKKKKSQGPHPALNKDVFTKAPYKEAFQCRCA